MIIFLIVKEDSYNYINLIIYLNNNKYIVFNFEYYNVNKYNNNTINKRN
jgi:hypothetical protein